MVLRALWMVTGGGGGGVEMEVADTPGTFLVSDAACPGVTPASPSLCEASELLARPGCGDGLAGCPASVAPEGSQLVLHGETPSSGKQPPPRLSRINPLLPVTEPCGVSKWAVPLPLMSTPGLGEQRCVAPLGAWSKSVPLSKASGRGDRESLLAAS